MYVTWLCLVLVPFLAVCLSEKTLHDKLDDQGEDVDKLTARVETLTSQITSKLLDAIETRISIEDLDDYLQEGKGSASPCAKSYFHCGSDTLQCVSDLLVCDGTKDCRNGRDESYPNCEIRFRPRSQYVGRVIYDNCLVQPMGDWLTEFTILNIRQNPVLRSRPTVELQFSGTFQVKTTSIFRQASRQAIYNPGTRSFQYETRGYDNSLLVTCSPTSRSEADAICYSSRRALSATEKPCAMSVFTLKNSFL